MIDRWPWTALRTLHQRMPLLVSTTLVGVTYLVNRVLGLARDVIVSAQFGTSSQLEAYQAALSISDLLSIVVNGAVIGTACVPLFVALEQSDGPAAAWRLINSILNMLLLIGVLGYLVIALLAEPLVALTVGRGFGPDQRALTAALIRLLLLQPALLGIAGLVKATLESVNRFGWVCVATLIYNLSTIGGAVLARWWGVAGLVAGLIGGAVLLLVTLALGATGWLARGRRGGAGSADAG